MIGDPCSGQLGPGRLLVTTDDEADLAVTVATQRLTVKQNALKFQRAVFKSHDQNLMKRKQIHGTSAILNWCHENNPRDFDGCHVARVSLSARVHDNAVVVATGCRVLDDPSV